ncbi:MAG: GspMb/PilO family protein [Gammaproteobacteria bacterium]|nr:GspMb/PilO family protein [Gammaproteobacteria bacterium]
MTKKEKKLLWVFVVLVAVGVITQAIPFAIRSYYSGVENIQLLQEKINRLDKLQARETYWQTEFKKNNKKEQQLLKQLFVGQFPDLIAARVQGKLKTLARESGIQVDSMSLPDLKQFEDWLLISQTMSFKAPSENLMKLLQMIKQSQPTLIMTEVQVRSYRKVLSCTIKILGFSRPSTELGSTEQGSDV